MKTTLPTIAALLALNAHGLFAANIPATEDSYIAQPKNVFSGVTGKSTTLPVSFTARALVKFEIDGLGIPSNQVQRASLRVYVSSVTAIGEIEFRSLVAGTSGNWAEDAAKNVPGPALDSGEGITVNLTDKRKRFITVDVTDWVKLWLNTPSTNNGVAIISKSGLANIKLGSKEGFGIGYPAELEIESNPVLPLFSGGDPTTGTLNGASIFAGSVGSNQIGAGAVTTGNLATGAVSSAKLADGTVTSAKLASGLTLSGTTTGAFSGSLTGTVSATAIALPTTTDISNGTLTLGGSRFLHAYGGSTNFFAGASAGNFTMTGTSNIGIGISTLSATTSGSADTAIGAGSLVNNTTGSSNTAIGLNALNSNQTGGSNTAVGVNALRFDISGGKNTAIGSGALSANTVGENTAVGYVALGANTTGTFNTANGTNALASNVSGSSNTAVGYFALYLNETTNNNSAFGYEALYNNTTGSPNTALGASALFANTTGNFNTAIGFTALSDNLVGKYNTACGHASLASNNADRNTAIGYSTLNLNTTGTFNTAVGMSALRNNITGADNTAIGVNALANATGSGNMAFGSGAGESITTGDLNILIGNAGAAADTSIIRIGSGQTRTFIAGIRGQTTLSNNAVAVVVDGNGNLGTVSSSRRYKEDIADMGDASARLQALRPVTFHYKQPYADGGKPVQYGLIAEEVAQAFPELAVFNDQGQPETVKYQDLTPLLLNEVQKLTAEKDALKKQLAERDTRDKERDERISRLESLLIPAPAADTKGN